MTREWLEEIVRGMRSTKQPITKETILEFVNLIIEQSLTDYIPEPLSRVVLIYTTAPDFRPLAFIRNAADAPSYIQERLGRAENAFNGRSEQAALHGGTAADVAVQRWRAARWTEVDLDIGPSSEPTAPAGGG